VQFDRLSQHGIIMPSHKLLTIVEENQLFSVQFLHQLYIFLTVSRILGGVQLTARLHDTRSLCATIYTNAFITQSRSLLIMYVIETFGAEKEIPRLRLKRKRLLG
jgi:hypothetical protein